MQDSLPVESDPSVESAKNTICMRKDRYVVVGRSIAALLGHNNTTAPLVFVCCILSIFLHQSLS